MPARNENDCSALRLLNKITEKSPIIAQIIIDCFDKYSKRK
jgi:hypothetical protein